MYKDLREEITALTLASDTPAIAIDGLSADEPEAAFPVRLAFTASPLPTKKPRSVMDIDALEYIRVAIANGIDMFDRVLPTSAGRDRPVFTYKGAYSLKKLDNTFDQNPIAAVHTHTVCRTYSRVYMRRLCKTREILCSMSARYHNRHGLRNGVKTARAAVEESGFSVCKADFLREYTADTV
jgi:queuine tRNA-ribosyltransferase